MARNKDLTVRHLAMVLLNLFAKDELLTCEVAGSKF